MSDLPPPDWYPDPEDATQLRYWDGEQWTEHRSPRPTPQPPPPPPSATPGTAAQSWGQAPPGGGWGPAAQPGGWGSQTSQPPVNVLAILSLVAALVWLGGLGSVAAVVLGLIGLSQIRKKSERGRGLAIAGIVVGALGALVTALLFVGLVQAGDDVESFFDCVERELETGQDLNC